MKSFFEGRTSPEKPKFLFHGSTKGDITEFIPKISEGTGSNEGKQVYATPNLMVASAFMASGYIKQKWSTGLYGGTYCALITMPKNEFVERDKGGYTYSLPSDTFSTKSGRGLNKEEYASAEPVKPEGKIFYPSVLEAMLELGVQVYFVNEDDYKTLEHSPGNQKHLFFKKLRSENVERGVNVKENELPRGKPSPYSAIAP
jgi:hypothetical protein